MRRPPEAVTGDLLRLRQLPLAVGKLEALPDPQIVDRQNVGPAQIEDEQHLGCPAANTLDAGEALRNLSVGHAIAFIERRDVAVHGLLGDAEDVAGLGSGQPRAPEPLRGGSQDRFRVREAVVAKQRPESAQNRASGLPAELLVDDGVDQRLEGRETAAAHFDRANAVNQPGHRRVGSEVGQCAFAHRATIALS